MAVCIQDGGREVWRRQRWTFSGLAGAVWCLPQRWKARPGCADVDHPLQASNLCQIGLKAFSDFQSMPSIAKLCQDASGHHQGSQTLQRPAKHFMNFMILCRSRRQLRSYYGSNDAWAGSEIQDPKLAHSQHSQHSQHTVIVFFWDESHYPCPSMDWWFQCWLLQLGRPSKRRQPTRLKLVLQSTCRKQILRLWDMDGYGLDMEHILPTFWAVGREAFDHWMRGFVGIQSYSRLSRLFCQRSRLQLACGRWQSECEKASMPRRTFLSACCEEPEVYLDIER